MDHKTKQEYNELSKEVFGSSSRWQKLITKGFVYPHVEVQKKVIPNALGKLETKEFKNSKPVLMHHTEETILELMKNLKAQREEQAKQVSAIETGDSKSLATEIVGKED